MLGAVVMSGCTKTNEVNQAFSAIYTLKADGWGTADNGLSYSTSLSIPELTNDIQTNGGVLVYLSFDNGTTYEAIPEVFDNISYGALHITGTVYLDLHDITGANVVPPSGDILAKVVLISAHPL